MDLRVCFQATKKSESKLLIEIIAENELKCTFFFQSSAYFLFSWLCQPPQKFELLFFHLFFINFIFNCIYILGKVTTVSVGILVHVLIGKTPYRDHPKRNLILLLKQVKMSLVAKKKKTSTENDKEGICFRT